MEYKVLMLYLIFACLRANIPWLTLKLTPLNFYSVTKALQIKTLTFRAVNNRNF